MINQPPIRFDLLLTRSTTGSDPAFDSFQMSPHPFQTRSRILKLSQFHLQFRFVGSRVRRKNIQDQLAAVNDDSLRRLFQVASLSRSQVVIKNHQLGIGGIDQLP